MVIVERVSTGILDSSILRVQNQIRTRSGFMDALFADDSSLLPRKVIWDMGAIIAGIGTAVPIHNCHQDEAAVVAAKYCCASPEQARMLDVLYRMSGVNTRGSVVLERLEGELVARQDFYPPLSEECPRGPTTGQRLDVFAEKAGPLAVAASTQALERAGVSPKTVTHLVTVTCSGFAAPGFDFTLINELPLSPEVARTQVGFMGCHAALNALRVARAFVAADPEAVVLVCCVELCSLHYQYGWDPEQIVANALFADGAGACLVQAESATSSRIHSHGSTNSPSIGRLIANGSVKLPNSEDAMTWRVGDHGFRMTLSAQVPGLLAEYLRPWMTTWLAKYDLSPEEIVTWAVHPGGPRILNAFADAMSIPREELSVSREIMQLYGNMSSPTVLFVLDRLRERQRTGPCVAIGFGPGLVAEAALLN